MASHKPSITLYTAQTPNGIKISIALEELGVQYKAQKIDIFNNTQNVQKEPWFLAIHPNAQIPALTDILEDGQQINLFESGSILQYLVAKYDPEYKISYPAGTREFYEMNNWLFFQVATLGPSQSQANHYFRFAPERIEYAINKYQNDTRRHYQVLEDHLRKTNYDYLTGSKCTIADIALWGCVAAVGFGGVDIDEFPILKAWEERMAARPAVEKGRHVPDPHFVKDFLRAEKEEKQKQKKTLE